MQESTTSTGAFPSAPAKNVPKLATGDGALGFWKALAEVYSATREQRCTVHKTANVMSHFRFARYASMVSMFRVIFLLNSSLNSRPFRSVSCRAGNLLAESGRNNIGRIERLWFSEIGLLADDRDKHFQTA